ncbi:benomyl/methotrexate resistance protein [Mollisia scopiformis]|uniref:Benomyl/methotrexate resistance protein n=1 Tax=Mollisia scopiformis TaxID=149040 RepID=A0A194X4M9_MOLSC|nr:benomyl/methotrexate resistance protein [Mollisia scopiformis]KUJ15138.1 benomyl/methotrexate resistance protein [Mollisia scopiformis]
METSASNSFAKPAIVENDKDVEAGLPRERVNDANPQPNSMDPNIVDWDGPDDPENPLNWTNKKKWANGALLAAMTFVTPLASSMFAPGVEDVLKEFHSTSTLLGSLVVSVYILGYAAGPLAIAPCSEMYGRLIVYHVSNTLFVIFTIACAVSSSLNMLIGFRLLAGITGSTVITIGGGTFGDMFSAKERGAALSIWAMGPLLGPVVGPVAGGFLAEAKGWRWVFWVIAIVAGALTITMLLFLRETYSVRLLELKTRRLRKRTGNKLLKSKHDKGMTPKRLFQRSITLPLRMLFFSPIVLLFSFYMAVIYGYLYLLFTTITGVFEGEYGFSDGIVGLTYLGIGIGMLLGLVIFGIVAKATVKRLEAKKGELKPESRLPIMIPGTLCIPVGLLIYGWTAEYHVFWLVPIIGTLFVGFGLITTFMPISTYLIDAFTIYSASALAANTVLRSLLGALLPLAGPSMYSRLGLGWGNSLLAFIALAMSPLPVLFWKYGERVRTNPRFQIKL